MPCLRGWPSPWRGPSGIAFFRAVVPWRQEHGHAIGGEWAADVIVGLRRLGFDIAPLRDPDAVCAHSDVTP